MHREVGTEPDYVVLIKNNLQDPTTSNPSASAGKYFVFGRRSDNLRFFGLVRFSETSGVASSFSPFSITMKPALFLIVFPVVFFDNLLTKESGFCFPEVLSSGSISWAGSLCTSFLCIFNPFLEVFFLPHILHL